MQQLIKPKKIQKGDKVATVSLSWGGPSVFPHKYEAGVKQLEEAFGVEVVTMKHTLKPAEFLYNNPKARAEDLMHAFKDPEIKGIFCTIGGDDTIRLLPYIDFDVIKNNPKIFIGYSDTTTNNFMCMKAGLSSFYGPSIMSGFGENGGIPEYTEEFIRKALFETGDIGEVYPSKEGWTVEFLDWENPDNQNIKRKRIPTKWNWLQGASSVQGHLIGGCAEVLEMIKGTEIWPSLDDFRDAILFLETSEDAPSPELLKYWLRNYGATGVLDAINGIIVARPGGDKQDPKVDFPKYDEVVKAVLKEYDREDMPVITQMDFGHTDPMFTIPFGAKATIDCKRKKFSIDEPGVV
jgi:muramoyltetrapeptide carboxypeptidase LdcA involved in peptidoglycan recycling